MVIARTVLMRRTLLTAGIGLAAMSLSGCVALHEGLIGLTVNDAGEAVLVLAPCDGTTIKGGVTHIRLVADRERVLVLETKGQVLRADGEPIQVEVELDLDASMTYDLQASEAAGLLTQGAFLKVLEFTQADFLSLEPGEILTTFDSPYDVVPLDSFARLACLENLY